MFTADVQALDAAKYPRLEVAKKEGIPRRSSEASSEPVAFSFFAASASSWKWPAA